MSLTQCRILIVEDEPLLAFDYFDEFESRGALPAIAATLEQALMAVSARLPDLAVLDVNLGSDLVWPVAHILSGQHIPFLLITGSRESDVPPGVAPAAFLEKPVGAYVIADRLIEFVTRRSA